jgi:pSer/pThr/pTyr-binding forkhead associated (FHA) protein
MDESRSPADALAPVQGPLRREAPAAAESTAGVPLRLVLQGTSASVTLTRGGSVLGRHSSADVRLPLPDVSRRHCRFDFAGGRWRVIDLNSLNGVFVNDHPVREADLEHRDRLRLGGFVFEVDLRNGERTEVLPSPDGGDSQQVIRSIVEALPDDEPNRPQRRAS